MSGPLESKTISPKLLLNADELKRIFLLRQQRRERLKAKFDSYLYDHSYLRLRRVSHSQLYNWDKCPHKHWLISIAKEIPYETNEYTIYGYAVHAALEYLFLLKFHKKDVDIDAIKRYYIETCRRDVEKYQDQLDLRMLQGMLGNVTNIIDNLPSFLEETFGQNYEIISVEETLREPVEYDSEKFRYQFVGYIDLVIKDEDGKYHLIDFKTSKKGWNKYQLRDTVKLYQLILYKNYWLEKYSNVIKSENVQVHYVILKGNGKVSLVKTTSGQKRMDNAVKLMKTMIWNAYERGFFIKRKGECKFCECRKFYNQ